MGRKLIFAAAIALVLLLTSPAWAQYYPPVTGKSTFTNANGNGLDQFYSILRQSQNGVVRIVSFGDSIIRCYQVTPCVYGAYNAANNPMIGLRNELLKYTAQYSTGMRTPFTMAPIGNDSVDGGEGGYVLTSGTITQSNAGGTAVFGPGQTGFSFNGNALLEMTTSGGVLTITPGQAWTSVNIYCVETSTSTGWTVTAVTAFASTSIGTACNGTTSTATGFNQNFSTASLETFSCSSCTIAGNVLTLGGTITGQLGIGATVASGSGVTVGTTVGPLLSGTANTSGATYQLSASFTVSSGEAMTFNGGLVSINFTLTSLGTSSYLGGYEAITTMGTTGVVVDELGEASAVAAYWTQNATALGWFNLLPGNVALCILEDGENDSYNSIAANIVTANLQVVATVCQNRGASVLLWIPPPWGGAVAAYTDIQLAEWQYGQAPATGAPWDILVMGDLFPFGGVTGTSGAGGTPNFLVQNNNTGYMVAAQLLATDSEHPTDFGACLITNQLFQHLSGGRLKSPCYNANPENIQQQNTRTLTAAYTNASTTFSPICEASCVHTFEYNISAFEVLHIDCTLQYQVSATTDGLILELAQTTGSATPVFVTQSLQWFTSATAYNNAGVTGTAFATQIPTTGVAATVITTNYVAHYTAVVQQSTTVNSASTVTVEAKGVGTGTLTINAGSACYAW